MRHDSSATVSAGSLLWLAGILAILLLTMGDKSQWVSWTLSGTILSIIAGVNVLWPLWRWWRMRTPFRAYFRSAQHSESECDQTEITLPRDSLQQIQVNRKMRVTHLEYSLRAVFLPANPRRPEIHSVENQFVSRGIIREKSPDTHEDHYITDKGAYHIKSEEKRIRNETYSMGYVVQTHAPGEYELQIETTTELGKGRSANKLKVVVE